MILRLGGVDLQLEPGRPLLMAIVNAGSDSFSDPGERTLADAVAAAHAAVAEGAAIVDVGGESGRTDRGAIPVEEEIERVVPVVEQLARERFLVSVDTWRAPVALAALEAGAALINDVSGLVDAGVAHACAEHQAGLVVTHTRVAPKTKGFPDYADLLADVAELLRDRAAAALELGVPADGVILDPGIDLAKTPAQSVELLRRLDELRVLERPLLVGLSRKDFVGALTGRAPAERDAGTLAALGAATAEGADILRVHDVAAARDYLRVRAALAEHAEVPEGPLANRLRREPAP